MSRGLLALESLLSHGPVYCRLQRGDYRKLAIDLSRCAQSFLLWVLYGNPFDRLDYSAEPGYPRPPEDSAFAKIGPLSVAKIRLVLLRSDNYASTPCDKRRPFEESCRERDGTLLVPEQA